jgi:hypothetical protein
MATYYIDPAGNDSDTGGAGDPWLTITLSLPKMSAGDTLIFNNGTYTGGVSAWAGLVNGTNASTLTTLQAANSRLAIIQASTSGEAIIPCPDGTEYARFEGFKLDGQGTSGFAFQGTSSGATLAIGLECEDIEIAATAEGGLGPRCVNSSFTNFYIHDGGTNDFDHGVYHAGGCHDNTFTDFIIDTYTGQGVQQYSTSQNNINNNLYDRFTIHNCGHYSNKNGFILDKGTNNTVRNLVTYGNAGNGLITYCNGSTNYVYNVTAYDNGKYGIRFLNLGVVTGRNLVALGNTSGQILSENGSNTIGAENVDTGTATDLWTNPAADDFTVKAGSALIDAGVDVGFSLDRDGNSRKQGADVDVGAYEYSAAPPDGPTNTHSATQTVTSSLTDIDTDIDPGTNDIIQCDLDTQNSRACFGFTSSTALPGTNTKVDL